MKPGLRDAARRAGQMFYVTGEECPKGHVGKRRTINGACETCAVLNAGASLEKRREAARVASARWKLNNRDRYRAKAREWKSAHRDSVRAHVREARKKWAARPENKKKINAYAATRRAAKLRQTPPWADLARIREIYASCPPGHHVDHVIPLRGKTVSGLHVPWNLQFLPALENMAKGATWIP